MTKNSFVQLISSRWNRVLLLVLQLFSAATIALGQPADVMSKRQNAFTVLPGQRIVLNGDSIVKGYGFGNYTNPSPLRTLYGIANILLKDNLSHPPTVKPLPVVWEGLNPDGSAKTVDTMAGEIA